MKYFAAFYRAMLRRARIAMGSHPSVCLSVCDVEVFVVNSLAHFESNHVMSLKRGQDRANVRLGSSLLAASNIINLSKWNIPKFQVEYEWRMESGCSEYKNTVISLKRGIKKAKVTTI